VNDGKLLITDVFLVEQVSGPGATELTSEGVAQLLIDLEQAGEDSGQIRCWVHSHGHSDVFWSTTDEQCIHDLRNDGWVLSWVTNKAGDDRLRLDLYQPIRMTVGRLDLQVHVVDDELRNWCEKEFADKVEERSMVLRRGPCKGRCRSRPDGWMSGQTRLEPPWPNDIHEGDDGHPLIDGEDWDDRWDDDWSLRDEDHQLRIQLDDPWNACMALEARP